MQSATKGSKHHSKNSHSLTMILMTFSWISKDSKIRSAGTFQPMSQTAHHFNFVFQGVSSVNFLQNCEKIITQKESKLAIYCPCLIRSIEKISCAWQFCYILNWTGRAAGPMTEENQMGTQLQPTKWWSSLSLSRFSVLDFKLWSLLFPR